MARASLLFLGFLFHWILPCCYSDSGPNCPKTNTSLLNFESEFVMLQHQLRGVFELIDDCSFRVSEFDMLQGSDVRWWGAIRDDFTNLTTGFGRLPFGICPRRQTLGMCSIEQFEKWVGGFCPIAFPGCWVRWTLKDEDGVIDIGLEAATGNQNYMAFGWADPNSSSKPMVGADVTIQIQLPDSCFRGHGGTLKGADKVTEHFALYMRVLLVCSKLKFLDILFWTDAIYTV
ncbi:DOMON domain-containing protein [Actinidia rufa]|uniref:DOMON domain-containing protein n=1 Tax=Actinidia rufa TaxID=165716 RepID=A0A7J0DTE3_9ERIC|nr:DOMON domain-containing protein [Actinidia rufa]